MRCIIAGTRTCDRKDVLATAVMNSKFTITEIISGGASGADALGEAFAKEFNIPLKVFKADWNTWGRAAGPKRNRQMADYAIEAGAPAGLIALWDGKSRGTDNMIRTARVIGLHVYIETY